MLLKLVNEKGLQTLSGFVKQAIKAADGNTSAVSGLGEDFQELVGKLNEVLQEVEGVLQTLDAVKANIAIRKAFTIPPSLWTEANDMEVMGYPYKCVLNIPDVGVDAESRVDVVLDPDSSEMAGFCGMCTTSSTTTNAVIIWCRTKPEDTLTGQLYVTEGAEYPSAKSAKMMSEGQETEQKEE